MQHPDTFISPRLRNRLSIAQSRAALMQLYTPVCSISIGKYSFQSLSREKPSCNLALRSQGVLRNVAFSIAQARESLFHPWGRFFHIHFLQNFQSLSREKPSCYRLRYRGCAQALGLSIAQSRPALLPPTSLISVQPRTPDTFNRSSVTGPLAT
jgi:hypothetical protein